MSYILEALNKSQRDHARGSVPTLHGPLPPPRPLVRRVGPLAVALLLGVLVTLLVVGYLWGWQDPGTEAVSTSSVSGLADSRSGSPGSGSGPGPSPDRSGGPVTRPAPLPVERVDRVDEAPARAAESEAGQNGVAAATPTVLWKPVRQPAAKAWSELPADIRRTIGNLVLNIHVYSERPEKRFAFINEREYGEGDVLKEGPMLEAINPGGLVLVYRQERFRIDM